MESWLASVRKSARTNNNNNNNAGRVSLRGVRHAGVSVAAAVAFGLTRAHEELRARTATSVSSVPHTYGIIRLPAVVLEYRGMSDERGGAAGHQSAARDISCGLCGGMFSLGGHVTRTVRSR